MVNDSGRALRTPTPSAFRAAALYTLAVVAVAAIAFAVYAFFVQGSVLAASATPLVLLLGGIGAFVRTYREWRSQGGWVAWQGAGWFLLIAMLVSLAIPGTAIMAEAVR
jgi:hypothetical protein